jgi:hypothetical protein
MNDISLSYHDMNLVGGLFYSICGVLHNTSLDELLAWGARSKGGLLFFVLFWVTRNYLDTHERLQNRYGACRDMSLETLYSPPTNRSAHRWICVSGFLENKLDVFKPWISPNHLPWAESETVVVRYESEFLEGFRDHLDQMETQKLFRYFQFAKVLAAGLFNPFALPRHVSDFGSKFIDNPFSVAAWRSARVGRALAKKIYLADKPVSLVA